jgi:hypothetical protein
MNITQMINDKGNAAVNQFVITTDEGQYFKSYDTLIAFKPRCGATPVLTSSWCASAPTTKHLKLFLGCSLSKAQIQSRIKAGSLIVNNSLTIK